MESGVFGLRHRLAVTSNKPWLTLVETSQGTTSVVYFYFNSNECIPCTFIVTEKFPPYTSTATCIYTVILICFQPVPLIHPTCTVIWNAIVPFNMLSLVLHLSLHLFIIPIKLLVLIYFCSWSCAIIGPVDSFCFLLFGVRSVEDVTNPLHH